jgi:hypothetical protein
MTTPPFALLIVLSNGVSPSISTTAINGVKHCRVETAAPVGEKAMASSTENSAVTKANSKVFEKYLFMVYMFFDGYTY